MKTARQTMIGSRKQGLRSISPELAALPSMNAVKGIDRKNFRNQRQPSVISHATQNAGLMLYEMLSMAELMRVAYEKGELASVQNRLTLLITEAADLASSLSDILALTKLEEGPAEATCERFDIVVLLREVSEAGRSIASDKPVTVMDVSCACPVMIYSDRTRIQQIMMGLMSNAAKFTERGRIALILSRDDDEIRLTVADTGKGMAQEQINAVHEATIHGYDVERSNPATTGQGLRIVKALVKQLHGSISIASKTGEGTIVVISLPLKAPR